MRARGTLTRAHPLIQHTGITSFYKISVTYTFVVEFFSIITILEVRKLLSIRCRHPLHTVLFLVWYVFFLMYLLEPITDNTLTRCCTNKCNVVTKKNGPRYWNSKEPNEQPIHLNCYGTWIGDFLLVKLFLNCYCPYCYKPNLFN